MKTFKLFLGGFFALMLIGGLGGCEKKSGDGVAKMHWDRDMCERCKMAISDRKFAVQVVDPKTNKHYKFDDIGCAVLWFKEEHIPWESTAKIWITDAKTGEWIDARRAVYATGAITPMGFGFAAYNSTAEAGGNNVIGFDEVRKRILERTR